MQEKNDTAAFAFAGTTILLWASAFTGVKYAVDFFSPTSLMLYRFSVASITLLTICAVKKIRLPDKEDAPFAALCGFIGIFIYMWLFNVGATLLKSGINSFIIATSPIFSMLLSYFILKEEITKRMAVGVFISFLGLATIAAGQVAELSLNLGIVIMLVAAVCISLYNIMQRKLSNKYTPLECTTYSMVFGAALMLVFLPGLIPQFQSAPIKAHATVVFLGVFPAALAYLSWNTALNRATAVTKVTSFMYLTPFLATALSYILLGEVISMMSFLGGVVIIAGMFFANRAKKQTESVVPDKQA